MKLLLTAALVLAALPASCRPPAAFPAPPCLHWPQFPVRVCVLASNPAQKDEVSTVLAGFDEWVAASRGKIRYVRTTDPSKADITVQLVSGRYLSVPKHSVGETTAVSSQGVLREANIRLTEGEVLPEDLQATAAHEFGHALGIQGHSDDPADLMFPVEINHFNAVDQPLLGSVHTVTAHDLALLAECYPGLLGEKRQGEFNRSSPREEQAARPKAAPSRGGSASGGLVSPGRSG